MRLRTEVIQTGKNTTGIKVPAEQVAELGKGKRPPVKVTINGYTYRSSIAPMRGENWIPVSAEVRERAGIAGGDMVDIDIELDTEPRVVEVPTDLAQALAQDEAARTFFEKLSYSNQRRHVLAIEDAKTDETRQRRITKSVALFHEGKS